MNTPKRIHRAGISIPLIAMSCAVAVAQTTTKPIEQSLVPFSDPGFGFELSVPAGWHYDRTRFQQYKHSIGLLRGRSPMGIRALQIVVFRDFDMKPFEEWIVNFGKASAEEMDSAKVEWETYRMPPRVGAVLTYIGQVGAKTMRTHSLCIPFDPNTVWVFSYSGSTPNEQAAAQVRAEFNQITDTLKVYYDAEAAEKLGPAYDRGRALIEKVRTHGARVELDDDEHTYEIVLDGKPIGYMTRRIHREKREISEPGAPRRIMKDGLRIRERSWRFADDGAVRHTRLDMFSSFDLKNELIENEQVHIPPPDAKSTAPLIRTDQILREHGAIFASRTTNRDTGLPDPGKPLAVGPVYLDMAWCRLLPGLLLSAPHEMHAVAAYSFETRALLPLMITPRGRTQIEGVSESCFVFERREGFVDDVSRLVVDRRGTLIQLRAGDLVLQLVPPKKMEDRFGQKRDAACQRSGFRPAE